MKYEQTILEAFIELKLSPREGQVEAINQVVEGFLDHGKKNIILCAPTGTGKSIIGLIAGEAISRIKRPDSAIKSTIILSATNMLLKQYDDSFTPVLKEDFLMLKGANNYECGALGINEQTRKQETAENCAWGVMMQEKSAFSDVLDSTCNSCEYRCMKKRRNTNRHLVTNYSYYFIDRLYTGQFEERDLVVWDEAHLINDLFSDHNAITFSQKNLQKMNEEVAETIQLTDVEIAKLFSKMSKDCGTPGIINDDNYKTYLRSLERIYKFAVNKGTTMMEKALKSKDMKRYTKLNKFVKAYEGRMCKIDDFFKYDYDHVFEYKDTDKSVSVKPIFVSDMFEALQASPFNLFLSATISGELMGQTLNLVPEETAFIKLDPTFAKENKKVIFMDPQSLSYTSLQNPKVVEKLRKNVCKIVKKHADLDERGIILTPSFKLQSEIVSELLPLVKSGKIKLYEHRQGEKLEHVLAAFKACKQKNSVLISPSLFEGADLPGDISRFQVLVKAPFPSLGDKRMKLIADRWPNIYSLITLMKCVQGFGRSVRGADDYATTYVMDQNVVRLFNSKQNVWKDEFATQFTQFIM